MKIDIKPTVLEVEINGEEYCAHLGDPDRINRMMLFASGLAKTSYTDALNIYSEISNKVHEFIDELFGEDQAKRIFASIGERDLLAELKLFLAVSKAVNNAVALVNLDEELGDFGLV